MIKLDFTPLTVECIHHLGDAIPTVAVSDQDSSRIFVYDCKGTPLHVLEKLHTKPVVLIKVSTKPNGFININIWLVYYKQRKDQKSRQGNVSRSPF